MKPKVIPGLAWDGKCWKYFTRCIKKHNGNFTVTFRYYGSKGPYYRHKECPADHIKRFPEEGKGGKDGEKV